MMKRGLEKVFSDKHLPVQYRTHSNDPAKLEFEVSTHDGSWINTASLNEKKVNDLFQQPINTSPLPKPLSLDVPMAHSGTLTDDSSVLTTRGISDCTALVVLTDLQSGIYRKRTLMHLQGGIPTEEMRAELKTLERALEGGGKVIFVGGELTRSPVGISSALNQVLDGQTPLLNIVKKYPASTTYATAIGIDVHPDGSYKLIDGRYPAKEFSNAQRAEIIDLLD